MIKIIEKKIGEKQQGMCWYYFCSAVRTSKTEKVIINVPMIPTQNNIMEKNANGNEATAHIHITHTPNKIWRKNSEEKWKKNKGHIIRVKMIKEKKSKAKKINRPKWET